MEDDEGNKIIVGKFSFELVAFSTYFMKFQFLDRPYVWGARLMGNLESLI